MPGGEHVFFTSPGHLRWLETLDLPCLLFITVPHPPMVSTGNHTGIPLSPTSACLTKSPLPTQADFDAELVSFR